MIWIYENRYRQLVFPKFHVETSMYFNGHTVIHVTSLIISSILHLHKQMISHSSYFCGKKTMPFNISIFC